MAQNNLLTASVPLLTSWEKIKAGVKGFVKTAVAYLPRGLMLLGALYGGSALLGSVTGSATADFMKVLGSDGSALAQRIGFALLFGGLVSGGFGAYEGIKAAEAEHQAKYVKPAAKSSEQDMAQQPQQQVSFGLAPTRLPLDTERIAKAPAR